MERGYFQSKQLTRDYHTFCPNTGKSSPPRPAGTTEGAQDTGRDHRLCRNDVFTITGEGTGTSFLDDRSTHCDFQHYAHGGRFGFPGQSLYRRDSGATGQFSAATRVGLENRRARGPEIIQARPQIFGESARPKAGRPVIQSLPPPPHFSGAFTLRFAILWISGSSGMLHQRYFRLLFVGARIVNLSISHFTFHKREAWI